MNTLLEDVTVLIPAAGRVPDGLLALSNISCPAMIPVGGRPVIHWTLSYLRSLGAKHFVVAVQRRGLFVEEFVDSAFGADLDVRFITPSRDTGVGQTLLDLAGEAQTSRALVVLGDTHFELSSPDIFASHASDPFVLTYPVEDSYRWCVVETDTDGRITRLRDKETGISGAVDALIGVYHFPDVQQLRTAARDAMMAAEASGGRPELAGILERIHADTPIATVRADRWVDCGNADMQASAHQTLLQARAFNEVRIDAVLGTLTKRSRNKSKFIDEINYLRLLPPELAVLFPRLLSYSVAWEDPWMQMEYYGYPTLADVFLFENVDPAVWQRVFQHLRDILNRFGATQRPLSPDSVRLMYLRKTHERLTSMTATPELRTLMEHQGYVHINGRAVANLPLLWGQIEAEVDRLAASSTGSVIHGDLCLSNVLYDLRSKICKLIDPRGSFGEVGVYGDPRYDVAKLWHSVHGLYDFIVNDLFRVSVHGTSVELAIRASSGHREIEGRFATVFFHDDVYRREIQLVTAILFASMPALHYDRPHRQLAMYARALQLFHEYFHENLR